MPATTFPITMPLCTVCAARARGLHSAAGVAGAGAGTSGGAGAKAPRALGMGNTVASQFRAQLRSLMDIINSTTPHFIRCIKPNAECAPNVIDKALVINQLKCGGVLEAARVSRLGECAAAEDFAQRCSSPPPHFDDHPGTPLLSMLLLQHPTGTVAVTCAVFMYVLYCHSSPIRVPHSTAPYGCHRPVQLHGESQ
jgi:hypothetical protein